MKTKWIHFALTLLVAIGFLTNAQAGNTAITKIYTTPYPPISMPAGLGGSGIAYEVVKEMMKRADVGIPIVFGDWDSVYSKALNNKGAAIFPIVMTPDRRDDFIWVGPIAGLDYYIYKARGSKITINNMNDIRNAKSIATVNGYVINQILKDSGCRNLRYYDTPQEAINETILGNNSVAIFPSAVMDSFLADMGKKNNQELIPIHKFMQRNQYYALNKNTDPKVAILIQKGLLAMQADGTLDKIYKRFMPNSRRPQLRKMPVFPKNVAAPIPQATIIIEEKRVAVPTIKTNIVERKASTSKVLTKEGVIISGRKKGLGKTMTIYAEEFAPFTFSKGGSNYIQGAVAEIVSAIQKELGQKPQPISITEWNSAYYNAKSQPNAVICTLKRIPERENDFYWIGPYAADSAWLYARRDTPLHINNITDAKRISSIACVGGAFAGTVLSEQGFSNLMPYSMPNEAVNDMVNFPDHAGAFSSVNAPYLFRDAGYSAINMKPLLQVSKKTNYYIGISKLTSPEIAKEWQSAFNVLKARGTIKAIMERWINK